MPSPSKGSRQPPAYPPSLIVHTVCQAKRTIVLRMLVDTGATYTMIPRKAAVVVGLEPPTVSRRIPVVTASAVEYVPLLRMPVFRCLGLELRGLECISHDLPPESAVDGLLGLNVLRHLAPFHRFIEQIRSYLIQA